jgi:type IV pilus assembly protein PilQ
MVVGPDTICPKVSRLHVLMPSRRLLLPLMTAAVAASPVLAAPASRTVDAPSSVQSVPVMPASQQAGALVLKLRRSPTTIDLLLEGAGSSPILQQGGSAGVWVGQLRTATPTGLRLGPQRISLPEAGLQTVSLSGSGTSYQLQVAPMPGMSLPRPVVSADGQNLIISFASPSGNSSQASARLDLRQPGTVPQPAFAPPLQARAVAPPLGDMAVGSMTLRNRSFVNISGPSITLNLRNAPARDALMALAQMGGYGFVYVEDYEGEPRPYAEKSAPSNIVRVQSGRIANDGTVKDDGPFFSGQTYDPRPVTVSFKNERFSNAVNSVLLAAGWQGRLQGSTLFAGPKVLSKTFGSEISKVYRLNQASAGSAGNYLASLGASITKVSIITNSVTEGASEANKVAGSVTSQQTKSQEITTTETYGGGKGPLRGLLGTTDSRLQTVTLVGEPSVVAVAENYLRQLDLRQRQVALSVKILDVSLDNDTDIANSFAFRYGNNFIVNADGKLLGSFNDRLSPTEQQFSDISGGATPAKSSFVQDTPNTAPVDQPAPLNPGKAYARNNFYDFVRASIVSRNTKVLASPTLILSENADDIGGSAVKTGLGEAAITGSATIGRPKANEAFVTVGEQLIVNYAVQAGQNGAPNSCQPQLAIAGLTFGARISKIDDNGFVTFTMSPQISAATRQQEIQGCGPIDILSIRRLDTGSARVRDGQTLVMTGVISDADQAAVTKWPILGDLPLVGQFFRSSSSERRKRELVILVSPKIVDDNQGGLYGYGYTPSTRDSRQLLGGSGI